MTVFLAHLNVYGIAHVFNASLYERCFYWLGYAVDLFFFLSGFIMYWVYVAPNNHINWRSFYSARAARILPLYYLTLLVSLPLPIYSIIKHGLLFVGEDYPIKLLTNFLMISGIINGWGWTIVQPAWSISVEVFCYLVAFPLLCMLNRCVKTKSLRMLAAIAIVGLCCHLVVTFYTHRSDYVFGSRHWDSTWLGRGIFGFTAGFFICCLYQSFKQTKPVVFLVDGAILVALAFFIGTRLGIIPEAYVVYSFPFIVFLTSFDAGLFAGLLKMGFFQWLGERSYSVYLWQYPGCTCYLYLTNVLCLHQPMYTTHSGRAGLIYFVLAIGFVLGISEISYSYFETTFRKWIRSWGTAVKSRPKEWWDDPLQIPRA